MNWDAGYRLAYINKVCHMHLSKISSKSRSLYYKTLQISNMQKVDYKFMSMLESVTFTEWDKHTSLLCILD